MANNLTHRDKETLLNLFRKHREITLVYLFGSRAKGTSKNGSDIDLAIMNRGVSESVVRKLMGELEESSLPYLVDIVRYHDLNHDALKAHIDRVGMEIYNRNKDT